MDDIVTRLREKYSGQLPICTEAADEIERLWEDVIYWQALSYCPKCGCGQCQDNEEALNNE
jgi:hypothetical protein